MDKYEVGLPGNTRNVQKLGEEPITDILSTLLPNVLLAIMFFATLPPRFIGPVTNNEIEWVTPAKYKQDAAYVFLR